MIKVRFVVIHLLLLFSCASIFAQNTKPDQHRLIILADMGNEADEEQQMVHMMMCSNEFELEGLIAVTGKYLRPENDNPYKRILHPELFHQIIDGYEKVLPNLKLHASGWHEPDYLRSIVVEGQKGYGIGDIGEGKASPGSRLILSALQEDDPRPIWVVVNAGSNTLAQALWDYRKAHPKKEVDEIVTKLRIYENGAQDNAGAWICANFPEIHWIRSNYQTYCYGGPSFDATEEDKEKGMSNYLGPYTWEPYEYSGMGQHQWAMEHIKHEHGIMGVLWPFRQFIKIYKFVFLEGGGTIPWMGLMNRGMSSIDHPHWGSWCGRFSREKAKNYWSKINDVKADEKKEAPFYLYKEVADRWINPENGEEHNSIYVPVWRWRRAMFNDFACRMDWCVKKYEEANHHPVAAVDGDLNDAIVFKSVKSGKTISFDGSKSKDPDNDSIDYSWWIYKEAGTYEGDIVLEHADQSQITFRIPDDAKGKEIHLILEVKDLNPIASLYDYRRIVMTCN